MAQEVEVAGAAALLLEPVDDQRRPGVHRRIDVAEVPLVGRQLAARVHVDVAQHERELLLGEVEVDQRQRQRVEGEIPGRVPRVLPLVRHRDDVVVDHVEPLDVAAVADALVGQRAGAMAGEPAVEIEEVVLLAPQHAGERLAQHQALVRRRGSPA